jgi:hypothetical protein
VSFEQATFDEGRASPKLHHGNLRAFPDSFLDLSGIRKNACLLGHRDGAVTIPAHLFDSRRENDVVELNIHRLLVAPRPDPKRSGLTVGRFSDAAEDDLHIAQMNAHFTRKVDHAPNHRFVSVALARTLIEIGHREPSASEVAMAGWIENDPHRLFAGRVAGPKPSTTRKLVR